MFRASSPSLNPSSEHPEELHGLSWPPSSLGAADLVWGAAHKSKHGSDEATGVW